MMAHYGHPLPPPPPPPPQQQQTFTTIQYIDAADYVDVTNTNPSSYTIYLPQPLRNVSKIELLSFDLSQSPIFTVIRMSPWINNGSPTNDFHQLAERIASSIGSDAHKSGYAATITNSVGTVLLQVFDVVTRVVEGDNGTQYMTIDAFTCTGRAACQAFNDWAITADGETANFPMTSDTGSPVNSQLFVTSRPQKMILSLDLDSRNRYGRTSAASVWCSKWESYRIYQPGDIVKGTASFNGTTYQYFVCVQKHLSVMLQEDVDSNYFQGYSGQEFTSTRPTFPNPVDGSFAVIPFGSDLQTRETEVNNRVVWETKTDFVQRITVRWSTALNYPNVSPYIWPYVMGTNVTNIGPITPEYTFTRQYLAPVIELKITHS